MKFLIPLIITSSLFAGVFTESQKESLNEAYHIGKQMKANDGMTFEQALRSIAFSESSAGRFLVGDVHSSKDPFKASHGVYHVRFKTAREIIKKDKWMNNHFAYLLKDDNELLRMLQEESRFGALIASTYLKMNYNHALKNNIENPWERAVSRYNGGNNNVVYIAKIRKNMKLIKKEIK